MNIKLIMLMESLRAFVKREDGASAIEYALIAGLIAVVIITAVTALGVKVEDVFKAITNGLNATPGA